MREVTMSIVRTMAVALAACAAQAGCQEKQPEVKPALAAPPPAPTHAEAAPAPGGVARSFAATPAPGTRAKCPVSGEEFTVAEKTAIASYGGRYYAFCCGDCKPDFEKNPAKFADKM
jgi:YHS domain-containing protein